MLSTSHPALTTLAAYRYGELDAARREAVRAHLATCPACVLQLASGRPRAVGPTDPNVAAISNSQLPTPLLDHPRYQVVSRLGEGAIGVVYHANDRRSSRAVVLKVLAPGALAAGGFKKLREDVRQAGRLSHPAIVAVHEAEEAGGLHFLVMEYVDGVSLDRMVRAGGPLPVELACGIIRRTALGLQHAHDKGVLHRDIKPHNLMLSRTGEAKILDFGLAHLVEDMGDLSMTPPPMAAILGMSMLGTADFCAPELARTTAKADKRSDLYALGGTLYYLLTGRPPFDAIGTYAKVMAHIKSPPPELSEALPEAPEELGEIIRKLMAKSPADRFQSAKDVAAALQPFATEALDLSASTTYDDGKVDLGDTSGFDPSGSNGSGSGVAAGASSPQARWGRVGEWMKGIRDRLGGRGNGSEQE